MIIEDELNMVYDMGSMALYDSNPRTEVELRDPKVLQKILKYDLNKIKNLLVAYKNENNIDNDVRPLAAKIIDFANGKYHQLLFHKLLI